MNRSAKVWMGVAALLFIVIIVLVVMLFTMPGKEASNIATTTEPTVQTQHPVQNQNPTPAPKKVEPVVSQPQPNTEVGSTFTVIGKAPGAWFFEATFPMQVRDKDNNVIGHGHANAQGNWQTTGIVGFQGTVQLDSPYTGEATLVLLKDNPSGLPENDDSVEIPISIK